MSEVRCFGLRFRAGCISSSNRRTQTSFLEGSKDGTVSYKRLRRQCVSCTDATAERCAVAAITPGGTWPKVIASRLPRSVDKQALVPRSPGTSKWWRIPSPSLQTGVHCLDIGASGVLCLTIVLHRKPEPTRGVRASRTYANPQQFPGRFSRTFSNPQFPLGATFPVAPLIGFQICEHVVPTQPEETPSCHPITHFVMQNLAGTEPRSSRCSRQPRIPASLAITKKWHRQFTRPIDLSHNSGSSALK